jgi:predicted nuclease of restriction endonuclease-like (RecB) superfamily
MMANSEKHQEFENIIKLIEASRNRAFHKVNEEMVVLYFNVGQIVSEKVAAGSWGDNTVGELADFIKDYYQGYGGFTRRGLYRMRQFYEVYNSDDFIEPLAKQLEAFFVSALPTQINQDSDDARKVSAVPTQLEKTKNQLLNALLCKTTWTNHLEILSKTKSPEEKFFYLVHCAQEKWSMRDLRRQLNSSYFERTLLANKNVTTPLSQFPQDFFKDPYIFEYLNLPQGHSEKDLEKALTENLKHFILEVGKGFTYMGNQYRLQVGNRDFYTDLLFYHRDLQCLVLFELKIQEFEPEFLGKLNFYLEALDRDVKRPHENPSLGILLCKGKDTEVVEYAMARNTSPAVIADYETNLIPKKVLENKLQQLAALFVKEE